MSDESKLTKKTPNCVDEVADNFGYSSFGFESSRVGSISFFKQVVEWPENSVAPETDLANVDTQIVKYNFATIKMSESGMLKLAEFIIEQHNNYLNSMKNS